MANASGLQCSSTVERIPNPHIPHCSSAVPYLGCVQGGSTDRAIKRLEAMREEGYDDEESSGLLGRCYKDAALQQRDPAVRQELLTKAYRVYHEAYAASNKRSFYTGINAAAMAHLLGEQAEAHAIATEVGV